MHVSGAGTLDTYCAVRCQAQLKLVGNPFDTPGTCRMLDQPCSHHIVLDKDTHRSCTHSSITPAFVTLVSGHLTAITTGVVLLTVSVSA
jgi:hypothetical protein